MPSPKLASASPLQAIKTWRLRKTLKRNISFRPSEAEDIRYAFAAYKKGSLAGMAAPFDDPKMSPEEFKTAFEAVVTTRYHGAWTFFGETKKGFIPIGFLLAFYSHPLPSFSPFMIVGDLVWFPWASTRNKIESAVNFFTKIRNEIPMVDYSHGEANKKFFEMLCRHGIMRRVGTMFNVVKGEPVTVFETRRGD